MRTPFPAILLASALWTGAASAAVGANACVQDGAMRGMRERVQLMHEQMDRIEGTTDRVERWKLLDLHAKHMREGVRELRHRDLAADCRIEMMGSILEEMTRHQLALSERDPR